MRNFKKIVATALAGVLVITGTACNSGDSGQSNNGEHNLTFQIWDINQQAGMQAIGDAYTEENPNVNIEVQVTSWDEYWTKLEAAATGGDLPDIFWMHTNEILKYADNGFLAETTDVVDTAKFSEISLANASGSDGTLYGVPKDKDTIGLIYNKEMFDQAEVAYPDETWTWDDLVEASQKIYDETGKYGYMPYADDQLGYWNFVYQADGYILNDDKTEAGFTNPKTREAMEFYIGLQENDWSPKQTFFAETPPGTAFFSELGAMFFEGNWNVLAQLENYPEMQGKWDVAVLPMYPNPEGDNDGRATISNGLAYSTSADNPNLDVVMDVLEFFASEEGQRIQGESGAAIPAYEGLEESWLGAFDDYDINVEVFIDMFDYGIQSVNDASRSIWKPQVNDELLRIYSGGVSLEEGLDNMQTIVDEAIEEYGAQ